LGDVVRGEGYGPGVKRLPGARTYVLTYGTQIAALAIGLLLSVVSARALAPRGRGDYAVLLASVALVVQLGNFGLSSSLLYWVSRRPRRTGRAALGAWLLGAGLLAVLVVVGCALWSQGGLTGLEALVILWAPLQLVTTLQNAILLGSGRYGRYNVVVLAGRVAALVAALLAIAFFRVDVRTFAISQILADALVLLGGARLIVLDGPVPRRIPLRWIRPVVRMALRAFPVLLLPFLLVRSDIFLMRLLRGAADTGVYSIAAQLVDIILVFPVTFAAVLFPALHGAPAPRQDVVRTARLVGAVLLVSCAALGVIAPILILLLFGPAYRDAALPFRLLLPGAFLLGVETVVIQHFARVGFPGFLAAYWAIGIAVNLVSNAFLIPLYGGAGAAVASTLGYGVVAILVIRRFRTEREARTSE
jgi:O-antigen/teichoic acid export membrane protein